MPSHFWLSKKQTSLEEELKKEMISAVTNAIDKTHKHRTFKQQQMESNLSRVTVERNILKEQRDEAYRRMRCMESRQLELSVIKSQLDHAFAVMEDHFQEQDRKSPTFTTQPFLVKCKDWFDGIMINLKEEADVITQNRLAPSTIIAHSTTRVRTPPTYYDVTDAVRSAFDDAEAKARQVESRLEQIQTSLKKNRFAGKMPPDWSGH